MGKRQTWIKQQDSQARRLVKLHRAICSRASETDLHQFRIGLRSLHIQLTPLARHNRKLADLCQRMKHAGNATNALRDRDALLVLINHWPAALTAPLIDHINTTSLSRAQALRRLRLKGFDQHMATLPDLLRHALPRSSQLKQRIRRTARKLRHKASRQLAALTATTPIAHWHAVRITVKKLRYLHEHLQQWLPQRWHALPAIAKPAQEALGHLHDLDVLHEQYGAVFSAELVGYWEQQRVAALVEAGVAVKVLLQTLTTATR